MKAKKILALVLGSALLLSGCGGGSRSGGNENCEHTWGAWTEETAATCTAEGTEKRTCTKCGKEEEQNIPLKKHAWGEWQEKEAPTCTQKGTQERECTVCHTKETEEIDERGHAEGVWKSDGEGHWKECPVCEEALTEKEPHTAENGKCTVCGGEARGLEFAVYENECHVIGIGTESGNITIPSTYCGKPVTEIAQSAFYRENITSVVVPDSVVYIRASAFSDCTSLSRVQLGRSVKEIGENAFNWDQELSEINLPSSLQIIGNQAFSYTMLGQIEFPSSLQSIGDWAFCMAPLQSVTVPGSVTQIGYYAFGRCESMTSIKFEKGIKELPDQVCALCGKLTSVSLPDGLETIGPQAFSSCSKLKQINIPSSVRELCDGAFQYTGLSEVTIPDTVEKLVDSAFYNCKSLTRVVIGNGVTSIGTLKESGKGVGVFEGCAALSDMTIGSGVTFICVRAFKGCAGLTGISFRGTTDAWKSIVKGEDWIPTTGLWGPTKVALSQVVCNNGTLTGNDIG